MSAKIEGATGVISVAIFGITAQFTPTDITAWKEVLMGAAPLLLILFLIWRVHKLDKQHAECNANWVKSQEQLVLAYRAIQSPAMRRELPEEEDFKEGNFCLADHPKRERI